MPLRRGVLIPELRRPRLAASRVGLSSRSIVAALIAGSRRRTSPSNFKCSCLPIAATNAGMNLLEPFAADSIRRLPEPRVRPTEWLPRAHRGAGSELVSASSTGSWSRALAVRVARTGRSAPIAQTIDVNHQALIVLLDLGQLTLHWTRPDNSCRIGVQTVSWRRAAEGIHYKPGMPHFREKNPNVRLTSRFFSLFPLFWNVQRDV
jgi:hypothetical protein